MIDFINTEGIDLISRAKYFHTLLMSETNFQSWKCVPHPVLQLRETQTNNIKPFLNVSRTDFVCRLNSSSCNPDNNCSCYRRAERNDSIIVDCWNRSLYEMPKEIVYLGGELIVDLSVNNISVFPNCNDPAYNWLRHVTTLNLENNRGLSPSNPQDMSRFLSCLKNIEKLYLADCNIAHLPYLITNITHMYKNFSIAGNPLTCTCESTWLKTWLQSNTEVIKDYDKVYCSSRGRCLG